MQPDTSSIPHSLAQVLWIVLASFLGWVGGWVTRRKREPIELDKLRAETRNIHTTADISPVGITLETLREIQTVIQKAEARREEWLLREEQLRGQIMHWRCKAEELDGELVSMRDEMAQLEVRYRLKKIDLEKAMGLLKAKHISFSETDTPRE